MKFFKFVSTILPAIAILAGCSTVPPTNVHQPMSVRPPQVADHVAANGAIFQASHSRPLFEDRRARNVGDLLTINIVETTSASQTAATPTVMGYTPSPSKLGLAGIMGGAANFDTSVSASGAQKFEGKGDSAQKNAVSGLISVTVIEVLPNGNLLVSGEKQMGINEGTEYVRFSGVVNPSTISSANTVPSTQVADARIEFKGRGEIDSAQAMGWMTRFFLSVLPF
jgi:flagellar L-ring protein precursor FlgH